MYQVIEGGVLGGPIKFHVYGDLTRIPILSSPHNSINNYDIGVSGRIDPGFTPMTPVSGLSNATILQQCLFHGLQ